MDETGAGVSQPEGLPGAGLQEKTKNENQKGKRKKEKEKENSYEAVSGKEKTVNELVNEHEKIENEKKKKKVGTSLVGGSDQRGRWGSRWEGHGGAGGGGAAIESLWGRPRGGSRAAWGARLGAEAGSTQGLVLGARAGAGGCREGIEVHVRGGGAALG